MGERVNRYARAMIAALATLCVGVAPSYAQDGDVPADGANAAPPPAPLIGEGFVPPEVPLVLLSQGPVQATGIVRSISVSGVKRLEDAAVLARLTTRVGTSLDVDTVREDLRSIYETGQVKDVRVYVEVLADDGVAVTYAVEENPAIRRVEVDGYKKITEEDIQEVIDIKAFDVWNESEVSMNARRIRDLYIEKGFYLAEVETVVERSSDDLVNLTFKITENRKVLVSKIDITGNENLPDAKIRRYLQTKQAGIVPWLTSSGTFSRENIENDAYIVRSVYLEEGYVDVKVDPPKVYLSPNKRNILISIHVEEGPRYRVGKIDVAGDEVPEEGLTKDAVFRLINGEPLDRVEADFAKTREVDEDEPSVGRVYRNVGMNESVDALETGQWFKLTQVQAILQSVSDLYADQGYAFANVVPLTETDPERLTVDVTFDIQKGEKVRIGEINITGNDPTWDKTIRREIPLNEGDLYSARALKEGRRRLERLGFFEEVRLSTPRGSGENELDMKVDVTEQPTGTFSVGAGFSNLESFVFTANVSKNNFLGLGYQMAVAANVSSKRQQGNVSFADPYFLDSRWTMQTNAYALSQSYIEDEYQRGGSLAIGRYLDPQDDVRMTTTYRVEDSGLTSIDAYKERLFGGQLYRSGLTSTIGLSLSVDKRNNRISATKGFLASVSSEISGGFRSGDDVVSVLGGDFNLWENRANFRLYQPVIPGGEWVIFRLNSSIGTIQSTDGSIIPYIHRFRAGGINSVRGFDWYSLGPTVRSTGYYGSNTFFQGSDDPSMSEHDLVVGGTETWVNNFELEMPIVKQAGISTVVFFDAGNAFGDPWGEGHLNVFDLRTAYGFGVRWFSPMGPLRFEWGFPVKPQADERRAVFDFSIGSFF